MKNLNPPIKIDHKKVLNEIIEAKRDAKIIKSLKSKQSDVNIRYDEYQGEFDSKTMVKIKDSAFTSGDKELISCYLSGGVKIAAIKQSIKDLQDKFGNEKCMYCQIKDPDSFDHFLPKDDYPEFCVLALNLIPCCTTCNKKKDRYWKEAGSTGIINFYLDSIPTQQILYVSITFKSKDFSTPIINFKLNNKIGIAASTFKLFEKHYSRLDLISRYNEKSDSEISEFKRTLSSFGSSNQIKNMQSTLDYSMQLKADYGNNYWKAVLFEELSKQTNFFT